MIHIVQINTNTYSVQCIFDEVSYKLFMSRIWSISPHSRGFYLRRREKVNGRYKTIMFHRELLNVQTSSIFVDHKNGNGLDNRLENLRLTDRAKNAANSRKLKKAGSVYKGVYKHKKCVNWNARIQYNGKRIDLGYFTSEKEAALAYDTAARLYFGEFAKLNFPEEKK